MLDTFIVGQVSEDINVDYDGKTIRELGGAVVYSGFVAGNLGHKVGVLPKSNNPMQIEELFAKAGNMKVFPAYSKTNTSIENRYHTADKEKRTSIALSRIEPYQVSDMPDVDTKIVHIAGLMYGDIPEDIIDYFYGKTKIAIDVQGILRHMTEKDVFFKDWEKKLEYLPKIDFLKTDAMEAEVLTGTADREKAAKILSDFGAKEIMITHNTEVLVYKEGELVKKPLKPRNLSGRSGRGDTCFSAYITERLHQSMEEAALLAAATVSLKMEKPGPFCYDRQAIQDYIAEFYS